MDDKGAVYCILEAVESLLAEGFRPERTLHLAFGHDEEVGGDAGALAIAQLLAARGVELAWVIDEGGTVADGMVAAIPSPIAVIGIAEKGSVGIELRVEAPGGHSSTPPPQTAIGILAAAIQRLERSPMPARLGDTTRLMLAYLGPELGLPARVALGNPWLFGGVLLRAAARNPALAAMTRTTTAATIFESGVKENVLPRHARAVVNFRILPGDSVQDVADHVRRTIGDERVELQIGVRSVPREPSGVSRVDSEAFRTLQLTVGEIFPEAIVAPYLVVGGTDARHFQPLSRDVYRFGPFEYGADALELAHGTDERISIENLARGMRFYRRFIQNSAGRAPIPRS
jgi:carboxypeptidase PM20D1